MLAGKKIILGVSGSIAAYKSAIIVRGLVRAGAEVRVLMTTAATDFISPLTLATLSKNKVISSVHSGESWNDHVELGLWADAYVIAPATATTLGKLANGISDNALVAVYLSARCPVFFAPAMDLDMWQHPATRENVSKLTGFGNHLIDVEDGELASGLSGKGRLAEPEHILERLKAYFTQAADRVNDLRGRTIIITAGPTYEDLDPVRYIGNRSTGKMGIALARAAADRGAEVKLILGPTPLTINHPNVKLTRVRTAIEMHAAALDVWPECSDAILAAAVGDYRPPGPAEHKIKKSGDHYMLRLIRNPDIAAELGHNRSEAQRVVGFALETENGVENARGKLAGKQLDFIVLNTPTGEGTGFGHDSNQIQIVDRNKVTDYELKSKAAAADDILDHLAAL